jgi:hypothetical protein
MQLRRFQELTTDSSRTEGGVAGLELHICMCRAEGQLDNGNASNGAQQSHSGCRSPAAKGKSQKHAVGHPPTQHCVLTLILPSTAAPHGQLHAPRSPRWSGVANLGDGARLQRAMQGLPGPANQHRHGPRPCGAYRALIPTTPTPTPAPSPQGSWNCCPSSQSKPTAPKRDLSTLRSLPLAIITKIATYERRRSLSGAVRGPIPKVTFALPQLSQLQISCSPPSPLTATP